MTKVYFGRHAEPNFNNHDDRNRELTAKGLADRKLVTAFLEDKGIDVVLSSPYKRAGDTVSDFADFYGLQIKTVEGFRERKIEANWIDDYESFCKKQWADFEYRLSEGESLGEVQRRNIKALKEVLKQYGGKTIVIGSHGTALSTIINYYDKTFGYQEFVKIRKLMPWIVKFTFSGEECIEIQFYHLFD